jgi:phage terminase small subunit
MADEKEKVLRPKEKLFISEYLKDFNATQAAIIAGYSKKTAKVIGYEILTKPYIQATIKKEVDVILRDNRMLALRVVRECEKIAFGKISDVMEFDDDGVTLMDSKKIDTSTIESVGYDEMFSKGGHSRKKRVKLYSKEKALEILAKYAMLYSDAPQTTLNVNTDDKNVMDVLARHGVIKTEN